VGADQDDRHQHDRCHSVMGGRPRATVDMAEIVETWTIFRLRKPTPA
jgi:hypothetical protein